MGGLSNIKLSLHGNQSLDLDKMFGGILITSLTCFINVFSSALPPFSRFSAHREHFLMLTNSCHWMVELAPLCFKHMHGALSW